MLGNSFRDSIFLSSFLFIRAIRKDCASVWEWLLAIAGIHPLHPPIKGDDKERLFLSDTAKHNPHKADQKTAVEHAKAIRLQVGLIHCHTSLLITALHSIPSRTVHRTARAYDVKRAWNCPHEL